MKKIEYVSAIDTQGGREMEGVVSPDYQVLIPKEIRKKTNLRSGHKLQVIVKNGVTTLIPDRPLKDLWGFLEGVDRAIPREEGERI